MTLVCHSYPQSTDFSVNALGKQLGRWRVENTGLGHFYCCAMHYGIYILFTHQQMHFLLNLEKFKFT